MKSKITKILLIVNIILLDIGLTYMALKLTKEEETKVRYESGVYSNKNWNETLGTRQGDVVPNEEKAIEIAKAVMWNEYYQEQKYEPFAVFYDEPDGVWIVHFSKKPENGLYWTGCTNVALQREDGKVLRIWGEE